MQVPALLTQFCNLKTLCAAVYIRGGGLLCSRRLSWQAAQWRQMVRQPSLTSQSAYLLPYSSSLGHSLLLVLTCEA